MRAELFVIVHTCATMGCQPTHHPTQLGIGTADFGFGGSIEAGFEFGPLVIAAEGQRKSAQQAIFTAQRHTFGTTVAGESLHPCPVAIDPLGIRQAVGRAQGQVISVIGQADVAPIARGFLRILGIGKEEVGRGKTIDLDIAFGEIAMREEFEAGRQIDEGGGAECELLRTVGFGARCGSREAIGFIPRTGQTDKGIVIARPGGSTGKQRIPGTEFDAPAHAALRPGRDVDHAANRFGAPDGAVRSAQDIDLARRAQQEVAEIEAARRAGLVGHAHTVDQYEKLVRIGTADIHARYRADTPAARQRQARNAGQRTYRIGTLNALDFLAVDHRDRLSGIAQIGAEPVCGDRYERFGRTVVMMPRCGGQRIGDLDIFVLRGDDFLERLFACALRVSGARNGRNRDQKQIFIHVTSCHERNAVHDGREPECSIRVCHWCTPPRSRTTVMGRSPGSRIVGPCSAFPLAQWRVERTSPVTVAGAARGLHPLPSSGLREQANP